MIYVFLSVFLYIIPFYIPSISPILFFSLVPIMMRSYVKPLTYLEGLVWGLGVYSVHLFWLLYIIFDQGIGFLRILLWIGTITWFGLWTGVWFASIAYCCTYSHRKILSFVIAWCLITFLYFYFVMQLSLFPAGVIEGYTFINPCIPLAQYQTLILCANRLGIWGIFMLWIIFQSLLVLFYVQKNMKFLLLSMMCLMPFILGCFLCQPIQQEALNFCFLDPWWNKNKQHKKPMFVGYRMVHDVTYAGSFDSKVDAIIMPESTFGWNLYEYQQFIPMMCETVATIPIVFGGQRKVDSQLKNTCFVIQDGRIIWEYDKVHLMPLVERVPSLLPFEIFTKKNDVFSYGDMYQNDVVKLSGRKFQVFLCSEFFCCSKNIKGMAILFLYNSQWLGCNYMKRLAELFIDYISILYGIEIVACS